MDPADLPVSAVQRSRVVVGTVHRAHQVDLDVRTGPGPSRLLEVDDDAHHRFCALVHDHRHATVHGAGAIHPLLRGGVDIHVDARGVDELMCDELRDQDRGEHALAQLHCELPVEGIRRCRSGTSRPSV